MMIKAGVVYFLNERLQDPDEALFTPFFPELNDNRRLYLGGGRYATFLVLPKGAEPVVLSPREAGEFKRTSPEVAILATSVHGRWKVVKRQGLVVDLGNRYLLRDDVEGPIYLGWDGHFLRLRDGWDTDFWF